MVKKEGRLDRNRIDNEKRQAPREGLTMVAKEKLSGRAEIRIDYGFESRRFVVTGIGQGTVKRSN